jgi:hypothetical protein
VGVALLLAARGEGTLPIPEVCLPGEGIAVLALRAGFASLEPDGHPQGFGACEEGDRAESPKPLARFTGDRERMLGT